MRFLLALVVVALASASTPAAAATETFADYSMMFQRSAGQHWTTTTAAGQWAWSPQTGDRSLVYWGDPANWPASTSAEIFIHDGDWVLLDGYQDSVSYYQERTTVEWTADADCVTNRAALAPGGAQRYVKWFVPAQPYCMFAVGTITQMSTGKVVAWAHQQVWSTEQCANQYLGSRPCLKQVEHWWDDNGSPWSEKISRTQYIGKDAGMAYHIDQGNWHADLRYIWTW